MNIYFTSDTHFGHKNILSYCNRPFLTIEEHDQAIIENWNSVVKSNDVVYHLGDVGWSTHSLACVNKLKGKIHLIRGNHDSNKIANHTRWLSVKEVFMLNYNKQSFFLSHYAHRTWNSMNRGVMHLYGHSHGNLPGHCRSLDVGVDCWNFTPVHMDIIVEKLKDQHKIPESGEY